VVVECWLVVAAVNVEHVQATTRFARSQHQMQVVRLAAVEALLVEQRRLRATHRLTPQCACAFVTRTVTELEAVLAITVVERPAADQLVAAELLQAQVRFRNQAASLFGH